MIVVIGSPVGSPSYHCGLASVLYCLLASYMVAGVSFLCSQCGPRRQASQIIGRSHVRYAEDMPEELNNHNKQYEGLLQQVINVCSGL